MTTKSEWVTYTGSDEQIAEIMASNNGYLYRNNKGYESNILEAVGRAIDLANELNEDSVTHYWIIPDDPLREMKMRQAMTGQPVWVRFRKPYSIKIEDYENQSTAKLYVDEYGAYIITTTPDWNIPNAEYSFTAFKDTSK